MTAAGALGELGRRFGLSEAAVDRLGALAELVESDPLAPTSVRDPERVLGDHIADSLVALDLPPMSAPDRLVDIGSGAGFPGLALAIARPEAQVVLLEASARKCGFLERAAARCDVRNVEVVHARAEAWPEGLGGFGVATARALAPLPVVLEYAAPLLEIGGAIVDWRGRRDSAAEAAAEAAADRLGLRLDEVLRVEPYPGAEHRHLHLATKIAATPAEFPRRPGAATKRPLGVTSKNPSDRARR